MLRKPYQAGIVTFGLLLLFAVENSFAADAAIPPRAVPNSARLSLADTCTIQNDAAVDAIYSYGEVPLDWVSRQSMIRAVVSNKGVGDLQNLPVTLNANGSNTFMNVHTTPLLPGCSGQAIVSFPYFHLCSDTTVRVSVPADDNLSNDVVGHSISGTNTDYSYKYPGTLSSGGFGFAGSIGAVVAKFSVDSTLQQTALYGVKLEFAAPSQTTYRVVIYGDAGDGSPSTIPLYVDSADRSVTAAGPVVLYLPRAVLIPGTFFVGIQQTNTISAQLAYDSERPVRSGSFFYSSLAPLNWTDFAPGTDLKPNIGCVLIPRGFIPEATIALRKTHGGLGKFDLEFYSFVIEPRAGSGVGLGDHNVLVYFNPTYDVASLGGVSVSSPTGGSAGPATATFADNIVTIQLTRLQDAQRYRVTLNDFTFACESHVYTMPFSINLLQGDVNGDGVVNAADAIRVRNNSGQPLVSGSRNNFLYDVNHDGVIDAADTAIVRSAAGTSLP